MFKSLTQTAFVRSLITWAVAGYLTLVARTTRWQVEGLEELAAFAAGPPCIVAFWHETLPSMPVFWQRAKAAGMQREATVLASRHRDGQLIADVAKRAGPDTAWGSTSRGGAAGLRALIRALEQDRHVGLTPDGPRGPRHVAAPGIAQLAALTGARILPCAASTRWGISLNSWDQMRLPLPFGPGRLVYAAFISVAREDWQAALPVITAGLNEALASALQKP